MKQDKPDTTLPELAKGLYTVIEAYQKNNNVTVAGLLGVLELVKFDVITGLGQQPQEQKGDHYAE